MTHADVQLKNVTYNAANQCFEALVTVHKGGTQKSYPCAIEGPIDMRFEAAAAGLKTQALRRSNQAGGMYSQMRHSAARQRAGRARFDPRQWLEQLGFGSLTTAA